MADALNKALSDGQGNLHSNVIISTTSPSERWGLLEQPIDFWTIPNFLKDITTFNSFIASHQSMCDISNRHDDSFLKGKNISDFLVVCKWLNYALIIWLQSKTISNKEVLSFNNGSFKYTTVQIDETGNIINIISSGGITQDIASKFEHNAGNNVEFFSYCFYFRYGRVLVDDRYVEDYFAQVCDHASLRKDGAYFTGFLYKIPFPYDGQINLESGISLFGGSVETDGHISYEAWSTETIAPSGSGGGYGSGGGNYDTSSIDISFATMPTLSAINTGLLNLYKPSLTALQRLGGYLWSTSFLDNIEKLWQDPMDLIVSLNVLPFTPTSNGSGSIKIGSINTNITSPIITQQFQTFNCGTLSINEFFGNSLDYSPYTKIQLFLPYVGIIDLDTDDVMNADITIEYGIDVFCGEFFAQVKSNKHLFDLNSVLYTYTGNMASNLPISAKNYSNIMRSLTMSAIGMTTGSAGIADVASGVASSVVGTKPITQRAGNMSNSGSYVGIKTPYLIITRPIQSLPKNYADYVGYPSNITAYLYQLEGFTKISKVITNTLNCTQEEQDEIITLLKNGVIL